MLADWMEMVVVSHEKRSIGWVKRPGRAAFCGLLAMAACTNPAGPTRAITLTSIESTVAQRAFIQGVVDPPGSQSVEVSFTDIRGTSAVRDITVSSDLDGRFEVEVTGAQPGPQTVCVQDACERVLITDETHESPARIAAKVDRAIAEAAVRFDAATLLPGWTVARGGPSTGTGGYTNPDERIIVIHQTSGRSVEDFTVTVLHEMGHAIDVEYLTEQLRDAYRTHRGISTLAVWNPDDDAPDERWDSPAEDFAELFVEWATEGEHQPRSTTEAHSPGSARDWFARLMSDLVVR